MLTPNDVCVLAESEDEFCRLGDFERIFPSPASTRYLRFFEQPRYLNILLNQWEQKYNQNRSTGVCLCARACARACLWLLLCDRVWLLTAVNDACCSMFRYRTAEKSLSEESTLGEPCWLYTSCEYSTRLIWLGIHTGYECHMFVLPYQIVTRFSFLSNVGENEVLFIFIKKSNVHVQQ